MSDRMTKANEAALNNPEVKSQIDGIESRIDQRNDDGFTMLTLEEEIDNRAIRILKNRKYKVNHEPFTHTKDTTLVSFVSWTSAGK